MRSALLAGLSALLSLGASSTNANIICDNRQAIANSDIPRFGRLPNATKPCIQHFCSAEPQGVQTGHYTEDQCGEVVLTITHLDEAPAQQDTEKCVIYFNDIVGGCIAARGSRGGTFLAINALYEAYVVNEDRLGLQKRLSTHAYTERADVEVRQPATKPRPTPKPKSTLKASPVAKPTPAPKPTSAKPQQDCTGTKDKGSKNGTKTARTVLNTALSYILRRAPPPTGEASCALPAKVHYEMNERERDKVWTYVFESSAGWQNIVTNPKAKAVFSKMNPDGKLNVVVMKTAQSYCVGSPGGKTDPYGMAVQVMKTGGKCLLTNGNYFVMGGAQNLEFHAGGPIVENVRDYNHFAVGFTTSTPKQVDVPVDHAQYYETFTGDDGSSLMCGPGLKEPLNLNRPELQYWCKKTRETTEHATPHPDVERNGLVQTVYAQIPGGLATSNQPNERLVTVIMKRDMKLVFSYTSRRSKGVTVNHMRSLVEVYLASFFKADIKADTEQVLNLDGGGSIFVAWVKNNRWEVIAAGNLGGARTPSGWRPRMVTTMIKHTLE
jgi:hypothetical protein